MSGPVGVGYESTSGLDTAGLTNSWGTRGGSLIRGIFNAVLPVTVVQRWFGELEGSHYGQTAGSGTPPAGGVRPGVIFTSDRRDWELHSVNIYYPIFGTDGGTGGPTDYRIATSMFTPRSTFDPVSISTVGPFGPQLVTNTAEDQGTVRGFGGFNLLNSPFGLGYLIGDNTFRLGPFGTPSEDQISDAWIRSYVGVAPPERITGIDKKLVNSVWFQRPLRIKRNRVLAFQNQMTDTVTNYLPRPRLAVSILYTELPNPRESYRT